MGRGPGKEASALAPGQTPAASSRAQPGWGPDLGDLPASMTQCRGFRGHPGSGWRGGALIGMGSTYADPWVFEGLMGRDAFGGVDGQHLVNEVFGFGSDGVPFRGRELHGKARHGP